MKEDVKSDHFLMLWFQWWTKVTFGVGNLTRGGRGLSPKF